MPQAGLRDHLERVHADTIGPLQLAHDHMKFILVARDEFSGWMAAVPIPSKTSPQVAQAFHQAFGFDGIETIRLDPGREFERAFEKRAVESHVKLDVSVPARPQTHSRAERFHQELENVVRTSLYQSGLPYTFWSEAVRMATENLNRTADVDETSPHEKRFGEISTMTLAPFGAGARYLVEERPKRREDPPPTRCQCMLWHAVQERIAWWGPFQRTLEMSRLRRLA